MEGDFIKKRCCGQAFGHSSLCPNRPAQDTIKHLRDQVADGVVMTPDLVANLAECISAAVVDHVIRSAELTFVPEIITVAVVDLDNNIAKAVDDWFRTAGNL